MKRSFDTMNQSSGVFIAPKTNDTPDNGSYIARPECIIRNTSLNLVWLQLMDASCMTLRDADINVKRLIIAYSCAPVYPLITTCCTGRSGYTYTDHFNDEAGMIRLRGIMNAKMEEHLTCPASYTHSHRERVEKRVKQLRDLEALFAPVEAKKDQLLLGDKYHTRYLLKCYDLVVKHLAVENEMLAKRILADIKIKGYNQEFTPYSEEADRLGINPRLVRDLEIMIMLRVEGGVWADEWESVCISGSDASAIFRRELYPFDTVSDTDDTYYYDIIENTLLPHIITCQASVAIP